MRGDRLGVITSWGALLLARRDESLLDAMLLKCQGSWGKMFHPEDCGKHTQVIEQ